ncbi:MAG: nucleotidyltransferase [Cyclobacteriaceae bacterium]
MRFSEETLKNWSRPASETEEVRISNAINMVKSAIEAHSILKEQDIEYIVQGSYANNTNVRKNSDIDICVMLKDTFYSKYREGVGRDEYGFTKGTNGFDDFRKRVINAMNNKFDNNVTVGDKAIAIDSTSHRVQADVVPCFQYRDYRWDTDNDKDNFYEGTKFFSGSGKAIINYPKLHIENGRNKNNRTGRRYKRMVRVFKNVTNHMRANGENVPNGISSFLLECLLFNVPDNYFDNNLTWNENSSQLISYALDNIDSQWTEVSGMFCLFHSGRKWNGEMVKNHFRNMCNYMGYTS